MNIEKFSLKKVMKIFHFTQETDTVNFIQYGEEKKYEIPLD
jgi:hypothetical protein